MVMPRTKHEIEAMLERYTAQQIEDDPILRYLRDKLHKRVFGG
jgi:hypothetical protein